MSNIRRKKSAQFGSNSRLPTPSSTLDLQNTKHRLAGIWLVLGLGTIGLVLRLFWLQIIDAPRLQQIARERQSITVTPFVPRRTIVDRSNNQVAIDRPSYTIYAHPIKFGEVLFGKGLPKNGNRVDITPLDMAQRLAPILERSPQDLVEKFQQRKTGVRIGSGLGEDVKSRVRAL